MRLIDVFPDKKLNIQPLNEGSLLELEPYRQHPIYKKAKTLFKKLKSTDDDKRFTALEKFMKFLKKQGFVELGSGSYGLAFEKPDYPWVFKIFNYDPAYLTFLNYALKHQDNPSIPKFKGKYFKIDDNTYVVRMEKLTNYDNNTLLRFLIKRPSLDMSHDDHVWLIENGFKNISQIILDLNKLNTNKKFMLDLHFNNIMSRDGVPVLIDPIAITHAWKL